MLNDRKYMKNKKSNLDNLDPIKCVYWLIGVNIFMYYFCLPSGDPSSNFQNLALTTYDPGISTPIRMVTAMFLHGSFEHLFFNMFGIYMFGRFVAPRLGSKRFLQMYFASGVAGNLLWFISNMDVSAPLVGASGAVFGILVSAALLEPNMKVMLLIPPIPLKLKTMVIVYGALEIFFTLTKMQGGVANLAHLGGLIGGYLMIRYVFKLQVWDALEYIFGKRSPRPKKPYQAPQGWNVNKKQETKQRPMNVNSTVNSDVFTDTAVHVPQKEMDRILDKISKSGLKTLTKDELHMLKSARSNMKRDV